MGEDKNSECECEADKGSGRGSEAGGEAASNEKRGGTQYTFS